MNNEQNHLSIAGERLLAPGDISESQLERVLSSLMGKGVDAADLYFQHSRHEHWLMEDGRVKSGSHSIEQGVGARVVSGDKTGFAYSDEIRIDALNQIASSARSIARQGQSGSLALSPRGPGQLLYSPLDPVPSMSDEDKLKIMREIEALARSLDPRITQVVVSLAASSDVILVANTDGTLAADVRPLVRLNVQVIAEQGERRESGSAGGGGRYDYRRLLEQGAGEHFAREAVRTALVNLEAEDAPAGTMTVVVGPGWPGVLLHEAVGHGLEGDFNRKGISAFSGRVGERVASELCTIVDDGTLPDRRGSLNIDDEGTPTQCTTLIENGVLKGYMQDRLNAKLSGNPVTGNGRRESFAHLPMPRMTNTYMLAGESDPKDIIASVKNGIYAVNFSGGQVDITSGKFVFSASEAYRIENGKVGAPVKGATLVGSGPEVLTRVSMVGNDLQLDEGTGVCGKEGQSVPVGVGQPTMRIDGLTVGGTSA